MRNSHLLKLVAIFLLLTIGCTPDSRPGDRLARKGDEISVAGALFHTTTPVVLWNDAGGYDAYRVQRRFKPEYAAPRDNPSRLARYGSFRRDLAGDVAERVQKAGWTLEDLRKTVSQVVLHFDACGTSRRCFEVLHDLRGLSCHFLIDLDGTIYQTLDIKERAWHAAQANNVSIGIEIANIGAYGDSEVLSKWYTKDDQGVRVTLPESFGDGGLPPEFVARPRREDPVRGRINGRDLVQYDFTEEQYEGLKRLLVALCRIFPRIKARVPRDDKGEVLTVAFPSNEVLYEFEGILGHLHVTKGKVDPGPAFDWERLVAGLRHAGLD